MRWILIWLVLGSVAQAQSLSNVAADAIVGEKPGTYLLEVKVMQDGTLTVREIKAYRLGSGTDPDDPSDPDLSSIAAATRKAAEAAAPKSADPAKYRLNIAASYRALANSLISGIVQISQVPDVEKALLEKATEGEVNIWLPVRQAATTAINESRPTTVEQLASGYDQASIGAAILLDGAVSTSAVKDKINPALDLDKIIEWLRIIIQILETLNTPDEPEGG